MVPIVCTALRTGWLTLVWAASRRGPHAVQRLLHSLKRLCRGRRHAVPQPLCHSTAPLPQGGAPGPHSPGRPVTMPRGWSTAGGRAPGLSFLTAVDVNGD